MTGGRFADSGRDAEDGSVFAGNSEESASSIRNLTVVEVRKNPESTMWYEARLRDVCGARAHVSFAGNVWPDREVPCSSVRPQPPSAAAVSEASFVPGQRLEIRVAASPQNPQGWVLGSAVERRSGLFHVRLEGQRPGAKDLALPPDALRPASSEKPLNPLELVRRAVPVVPELRAWLTTPDSRGCLETVRTVAGLGLIGAGTGGAGITDPVEGGAPEAAQPEAVILIGSEAAIVRGEMLLKIHMMHQHEVESFHARRTRKLQLLEDLRQKLAGGPGEGSDAAPFRVTFEVEQGLVGRICGKGGENFKRVCEECEVEVRVVDSRTDDAKSMAEVVITGASQEGVEKAREELELVTMEYEVDEEKVEWMLGKDNREVNEIARKAGLAYIRWNGEALELCGLRYRLEDAVMLLDNHSEYFGVFQEIERQKEEIKSHFEALDAAAEAAGLRPPPARKPAAGRGRGPAGAAKDAAPAAEEAAEPGAGKRGSRKGGEKGSGKGKGGGRGRAGKGSSAKE